MGLGTGWRVVGILQLILREKLIVTSRSWLWFASVGCLLQLLGGSKPVAMCGLTIAYSRERLEKRQVRDLQNPHPNEHALRCGAEITSLNLGVSSPNRSSMSSRTLVLLFLGFHGLLV